MGKKKIGIVGATGYTGSELVRILHHHPEVEITAITSESRKGEKFSDVHGFFRGIVELELSSIKNIDDHELDLVFLALPHGVSMDFVKDHADAKYPIVDLSGDFRLDSPEIYEEWYKKKHVFKEGFENAGYGIPELFRDEIKDKKLIANPGCFPTCAILGLAPLRAGDIIENSMIVDSKTGVTGAGIKAKEVTHFPNANDNFKAYGVTTHRHTIEIEGVMNRLNNGGAVVQFTPHLLPVDRGIISTIYTKPKAGVDLSNLQDRYKDFYSGEPFIRIVDAPPTLKDVRGTNYCDIYVTYDERTNNIITISAIDNLVKGAAGQAVQNMNLLFDWPENTGLNQIPLNP
ncbi:N-acetyl-gamma-glutamyl-phosphate reductase [Fulvivirga sp. RKSG066]|uniref:N-acetyl-gamma-glutamyl-phosphate reductase n=1 Tax=Fulvivirga aurantia TaxID=2529383 RepID=UPI0012BCF0CC|nr:N-acetyl-gamma-glutamyl-phosphate reductase [Fulvivirga aurantia]MTI22359.1 N-acetyl-gamma-glutamyl-phosphate reductase [Fulvivirga aurantia]